MNMDKYYTISNVITLILIFMLIYLLSTLLKLYSIFMLFETVD